MLITNTSPVTDGTIEDSALCIHAAKCQDGELSLVGGSSPQEGYIQFCNNGSLGMVCADQWGHEEAMVVCDQLGLPSTGENV